MTLLDVGGLLGVGLVLLAAAWKLESLADIAEIARAGAGR